MCQLLLMLVHAQLPNAERLLHDVRSSRQSFAARCTAAWPTHGLRYPPCGLPSHSPPAQLPAPRSAAASAARSQGAPQPGHSRQRRPSDVRQAPHLCPLRTQPPSQLPARLPAPASCVGKPLDLTPATCPMRALGPVTPARMRLGPAEQAAQHRPEHPTGKRHRYMPALAARRQRERVASSYIGEPSCLREPGQPTQIRVCSFWVTQPPPHLPQAGLPGEWAWSARSRLRRHHRSTAPSPCTVRGNGHKAARLVWGGREWTAQASWWSQN
jgi:hypothetical protein